MNTDVAKKYGALLERLVSKTQANELKWEMGENRNPKAPLGQYYIALWYGTRGGNPVEYMTLSTRYDEPIETVDDEDLAEVSPSHGKFDSYYPLMEELRNQAFRQAVGADKALDDILSQLDDDL